MHNTDLIWSNHTISRRLAMRNWSIGDNGWNYLGLAINFSRYYPTMWKPDLTFVMKYTIWMFYFTQLFQQYWFPL